MTPDDRPPIAPEGVLVVVNDCWNRIGVRGDGSCPELRLHGHCHHCPVFSQAAAGLLDRAIPDGCVSGWTEHFGKPQVVEDRKTASVVVFRIGPEWLALPTAVVTEVASPRTIHSLPHRRGGTISGLVNVRGELLVCVSLGRALGLDLTPTAQPAPQRRLLVIRRNEVRAVCPVDEVLGVHRFHQRDLKELPATLATASGSCSTKVMSWRDHSVGLLDEHLLFDRLRRSLA